MSISRSLSPCLPPPRTAFLHVPVPAEQMPPGLPLPHPSFPRSPKPLCPSLLPYNVPAQPLDATRAGGSGAWRGAGGTSGHAPLSPRKITPRMRERGQRLGRRAGGQRGLSAGPGERGREERAAAARGMCAGGQGRAGDAGGTHHGGAAAAGRCPGYRRARSGSAL